MTAPTNVTTGAAGTGEGTTAAARCRALRDRMYPKEMRPHQILTRRVLEAARQGAVILDCGCGRDAGWLKRLAPSFGFAVGFDFEIDPAASDAATPLVQADAHAAPLRDASVDVIVTKNTVEHFAEPAVVYREFHRVLRPGGRLFVLTVNQWFPPILAARWMPHALRQRINARATDSAPEDTFPVYYRANTTAALTALGREAGFRVEGLEYLSNHPEYFMFSPLAYRCWAAIERALLRRRMFAGLRHFMLATYRKPGTGASGSGT